jgi:hypothetical protein
VSVVIQARSKLPPVPQFKIRRSDGGEDIITASRSITDGESTVFQVPSSGSWKIVHEVPTADLEVVQRRVVEDSGMARWVEEKPKRTVVPR